MSVKVSGETTALLSGVEIKNHKEAIENAVSSTTSKVSQVYTNLVGYLATRHIPSEIGTNRSEYEVLE